MKITKRMPATTNLIIFSLLFAIGGVILGFYFIIYQADARAGLGIIFISLFFAVLVRLVADMGQAFFDRKADSFNLLSEIKDCLPAQNEILVQNLQVLIQIIAKSSAEGKDLGQKLSQELNNQLKALNSGLISALAKSSAEGKDLGQKLSQDFRDQLAELTNSVVALNDALDKISCDSKDINQSIQQIRSFFEQIEKRLDLNK